MCEEERERRVTWAKSDLKLHIKRKNNQVREARSHDFTNDFILFLSSHFSTSSRIFFFFLFCWSHHVCVYHMHTINIESSAIIIDIKKIDPHLVVSKELIDLNLIWKNWPVFDCCYICARQLDSHWTERWYSLFYSMAKDEHEMNQRMDESMV